MTRRGNINHFGVGRMDQQAPDVQGVIQPNVPPAITTIGRLVNPVAPRGTLTIVRFPAADPHDGWIRGCDCNIADAAHLLIVEHWFPRHTVVRGAPNPSGSGRDEHNVGIRFDHSEIIDPAAHVRRANIPPLELIDEVLCGLSTSRLHPV